MTHLPLARRALLQRALFGGGLLGLRSLATGLPASFLLDPLRAAGQSNFVRPQFLVLNTSGAGDPINCNCPGTYLDPKIAHPGDARMARTSIQVGGTSYDAAKPWATLGALAKAGSVLDRMAFIHHSTETEQHLAQPDVQGLMGRVAGRDMALSAFAAALAPVLGSVQSAPVVLGAAEASEAISVRGRPQPLLNPSSLGTVLGGVEGPLGTLQSLRDQDLDRIHALLRARGTPGQRRFLDDYALSKEQARKLSSTLLDQLSQITDDGPDGQLKAALVLIQMKVTPAITVHVPFGGDNHFDGDLTKETEQTVNGMASLGRFFDQLATAGLSDTVTFASFNVFGRTLLLSGGRSHNRHHHVTLIAGRNVRGSVIGGLAPVDKDYGAQPFSSQTGRVDPGGDVSVDDGLPSAAKTLGAALGIPRDVLDGIVQYPSSGETVGKVVAAALAPA